MPLFVLSYWKSINPLHICPICISLVSGLTQVSHSDSLYIHGHFLINIFDPLASLSSSLVATGFNVTEALWYAGIMACTSYL